MKTGESQKVSWSRDLYFYSTLSVCVCGCVYVKKKREKTTSKKRVRAGESKIDIKKENKRSMK